MFSFHFPKLTTDFDKQAATSEKLEKMEKVGEVKNENAVKEEEEAENNLLPQQRRYEEFILFQLTDAWGM